MNPRADTAQASEARERKRHLEAEDELATELAQERILTNRLQASEARLREAATRLVGMWARAVEAGTAPTFTGEQVNPDEALARALQEETPHE